MGDICMFTGHRVLPTGQALRLALDREVEAQAARGVLSFVSGGAMGFDLLAAEAVLRLRERISAVRLMMLLPCRNQDRYYNAVQRRQYLDVLSRADRVVCLSEQYYEGCMHARDRAMVDGAQHCICYLTASRGGTAYTIRYAFSRNLYIVNLVDML